MFAAASFAARTAAVSYYSGDGEADGDGGAGGVGVRARQRLPFPLCGLLAVVPDPTWRDVAVAAPAAAAADAAAAASGLPAAASTAPVLASPPRPTDGMALLRGAELRLSTRCGTGEASAPRRGMATAATGDAGWASPPPPPPPPAAAAAAAGRRDGCVGSDSGGGGGWRDCLTCPGPQLWFFADKVRPRQRLTPSAAGGDGGA